MTSFRSRLELARQIEKTYKINTNKIKQATFRPIETRIDNRHAQYATSRNGTKMKFPPKKQGTYRVVEFTKPVSNIWKSSGNSNYFQCNSLLPLIMIVYLLNM